MIRPGAGGVLFALCISFAFAWCAAASELIVNGGQIEMTESPVYSGDSVLVPLVAFAPHVGLDVSMPADEDAYVLRGANLQVSFDASLFSIQNGVAYASLEWLVGWADGEVYRIGDSYYVETQRARLSTVEATSEQLTLHFDRFTPHEVVWMSPSSVMIRIYQCRLDVQPRMIVLGESEIRSVQIADKTPLVELLLDVEAGTQFAMQDSETEGFYSLSFRVGDASTTRRTMQLAEGVNAVEYTNAGLAASYVYAETWRADFRLMPEVSSAGLGASEALEAMARRQGAECAVGLHCTDVLSDGLLIVDGIPYDVPEHPAEILSIDMFGRWSTMEATCDVNLKHAGLRIPIDGVNRPLAYDEVVLYSPGYQGSIARGVPGSFLALKIRNSRVVSVYQGPFVPADPTAVLIVASGDAKARLSLIHLSDALSVECLLNGESTPSCVHAFPCGPTVMRDGATVLDASDESIEDVNGGALLVCDWQGGLYMVRWTVDATVDTTPAEAILELLASLQTSIKDAVVLEMCVKSSIVYASDAGVFRLGTQDPVPLALCLVPLLP